MAAFRQRLWFDVEERYNTTTDCESRNTNQLWFDVETMTQKRSDEAKNSFRNNR